MPLTRRWPASPNAFTKAALGSRPGLSSIQCAVRDNSFLLRVNFWKAIKLPVTVPMWAVPNSRRDHTRERVRAAQGGAHRLSVLWEPPEVVPLGTAQVRGCRPYLRHTTQNKTTMRTYSLLRMLGKDDQGSLLNWFNQGGHAAEEHSHVSGPEL